MITCAIEPKICSLISGGKIIGPHKIEGIGDDFIPKLVDKNLIDKVILSMMKMLYKWLEGFLKS